MAVPTGSGENSAGPIEIAKPKCILNQLINNCCHILIYLSNNKTYEFAIIYWNFIFYYSD